MEDDQGWGALARKKNSELWSDVYKKLQNEIPGQFLNAFFSNLEISEGAENKLILTSSDERVINHINNRYKSIIKTFVRDLAGSDAEVQFKLKGDDTGISANKNSNTLFQGINESNGGTRQPKKRGGSFSKNYNSNNKFNNNNKEEDINDININKNYTFERFVTGSSNEHARAAAMGVAKNPSKNHNPLYIFGEVGLGKTHLLMAIANYIMENNPWMVVKYISAETFQHEFIEAKLNNMDNDFKSRYRKVDVFLIDDIQFISQKAEATQEVIFHTFNYLYQHGKQIVISGDRPPQQLSTLKDRLVSRFQSGLIVDIKPPNMETRELIIRARSAEAKLELSNEVIRYIATTVRSQVRFLEAVLIRIKFISEIEKKSIDLPLIKNTIHDIYGEYQKSNIEMADILKSVSIYWGINHEEITGKSRMERIALARHACMYLARKLIPNLSLVNVASFFGKKDHTTVIHAEKRIASKIDEEPQFKLIIDEIIRELTL